MRRWRSRNSLTYLKLRRMFIFEYLVPRVGIVLRTWRRCATHGRRQCYNNTAILTDRHARDLVAGLLDLADRGGHVALSESKPPARHRLGHLGHKWHYHHRSLSSSASSGASR